MLTMMKLSLLCLLPISSAFVVAPPPAGKTAFLVNSPPAAKTAFVATPTPATKTAFGGTNPLETTTALGVSTSIDPRNDRFLDPRKDDWSDKPLYKPRSTVPMPVKQVSKAQRLAMDDVVIPPDFTLTWALGILGPLIWWYHPSYAADGSPSLIGIFGGAFHILFAALLWVQTARVRLVFEKDSFEFYNVRGKRLDLNKGAELVRKPANYVSQTENRWRYDSVTNYGFFPSEEFPVICYFKETQTSKDRWSRWFAAFDSYNRGQPHFFPGIGNVHKIKEEFEKRGVKRKAIPTFKKPVVTVDGSV